jgi:hypothetical protein
MEKGPWREFLIGVVAAVTVALGIYYGIGLGRHSASPRLEQEERSATRAVGEAPLGPGTPSPRASAASPHPSTQEARKHLAETEAYIDTRLRELRKIGVREPELEQFTTPRLATLALDQAIKLAEDRATRITAVVTDAMKRQAALRGRIAAMLRKNHSESQVQRFMPRPEASLPELEELSAKLEEAMVKAMRE